MSKEKEQKTVSSMIKLYCRKNHHSKNLCEGCKELKNYAMKRLEICPYGEEKSACSKCPTHCYKPEMRERIKIVMRFSGPRMLYKHPLMAIEHVLQSRG